MAYPLMYLVKDLQNNLLFRSTSRRTAITWAKNMQSLRSKKSNEENPLCLVKSQFVGLVDELR